MVDAVSAVRLLRPPVFPGGKTQKGRNSNMLKRLKVQKNEGGFTLVELLIVVLILGALASTVVVASGGFKDKGAVESCRAARTTYETSFEAYRVDDADGMYPITNAQIIPKYQKAAGGSSATVSGTPEVAVVKGKGWTFTVTYGAADSVVTTGSTAAAVFSAFTPAACAS